MVVDRFWDDASNLWLIAIPPFFEHKKTSKIFKVYVNVVSTYCAQLQLIEYP